MTRLYAIDDEPQLFTLEQMLEANAEYADELRDEIAPLMPGESVILGGGAMAEFKISRVPQCAFCECVTLTLDVLCDDCAYARPDESGWGDCPHPSSEGYES